MYDIRECKNLVICPQSPWRKLTVYTRVTTGSDGKPVAFCNGCGECSNTTVCLKCQAAIAQMYMRGEPFPAEPFAPPIRRFGETGQAPE